MPQSLLIPLGVDEEKGWLWFKTVVKHSALVSRRHEYLKCHPPFIFGSCPVKNVHSLKIREREKLGNITRLQDELGNTAVKVFSAHKIERFFFPSFNMTAQEKTLLLFYNATQSLGEALVYSQKMSP